MAGNWWPPKNPYSGGPNRDEGYNADIWDEGAEAAMQALVERIDQCMILDARPSQSEDPSLSIPRSMWEFIRWDVGRGFWK